jgi:DNA-binding CsgD family transcriptional regulator
VNDARLIERDGELGRLAAAARSAAEGEGSMLVIRGPIGIGKSALLQAVAGLPSVRGTLVLRARASALEQDYAFGLARQLVGPGQATLAALEALVESSSTDSPLTMLVDDLHWADDPSLRWLSCLAPRLSGLPVLVVVTVRDGDPRSARQSVTEIIGTAGAVLRPDLLSRQGIRDFAAATTDGDDELAKALHETVGGNPLFLKSVLLGFARAGTEAGAACAELLLGHCPAQVREGMTACFLELPEPIRAVAGAMSVLGDTGDIAIVSRVAGVDPVTGTEAARAMRQLGIMAKRQESEGLHPLVRETLLRALTIEERERLHTRAATALHADGYPAEQVAAQLMPIPSPQGDFAIAALRAAADGAQRRGAPETAAGYLRRALLETSAQGEDRARLLVELAMVERTVDVGAAMRHIYYAVPLLRDIRDRAAALTRIAPPMLTDAPPAIRVLITETADEFGDPNAGSDRDRELGLGLEARSRHIGYTDPAELADSLRRLSGLGAEPAVETTADRELLIVLLYAAMLTAGKPAHEIARLGERVLQREPALSTHVHTALPMLVLTMTTAGSVSRIGPWLDLSLEHARRQGSVIEQALIRIEQAGVALRTGRTGEARTAMLEADGLAGADWISRSSSWSAVTLAAVAIRTQEPRLVAMADDYRGSGGKRSFVQVRQWARASQARARGDLSAALEQFLECGRGLERSRWRNPELLPWRAAAAETARQLGDLRTARQLAEEYRAQADEWQSPVTTGRAQRILGELTEGADGVAMLREAVATLENSVNRAELSSALTALGTRLLDSDAKQAGVILRRGRELAKECGDRPSTAPATLLDWSSMLSKAEARVARLAGGGLSNQEMAQQLGVSVRAIEKHLTNTYRKLGLSGRTELAETIGTTLPAS